MFWYSLGALVIAVIIMAAIYKARGMAQPIKWIMIGAVAMLMAVPAFMAMMATIL
jgi:hypothetical protein